MNLLRVTASYLRARRLATAFRDRASLEAWQDLQVQSHLKFVRKASGYYRDLFQGLDDRDWRRFPVSDKRALVHCFDALNTRGIRGVDVDPMARAAEQTRDFSRRLKDLSIGLSSGTSGKRALFMSSPQENDFWLGVILARSMRAPLWKRQRIALFHRTNSTLYSHLHFGPVQLRFFDILRDMKDLIGEARDFSPTTIVGPPSALRMLAEAQAHDILRIKPHQMISVAEVLDPLDRAAIEDAFRLRLEELYIATEGFLAFTCAHGSLHLNEDMLVVQKDRLPGETDRFAPIVTDFVRRVQPIVRYRLDDVLVEDGSGPCPCGSVFCRLKRIEGRCDDVLLFEPQGPAGKPVPIFPDFIRSAVTGDRRVEAFWVCQTGPASLRIELQVPPGDRAIVEDRVAREVEQLFGQVGARVPTLEFGEYRGANSSGKLRRVERRFTPGPSVSSASNPKLQEK